MTQHDKSGAEWCAWYGQRGHVFDGSYKTGFCMCGKPEPKVAPVADAGVKRPTFGDWWNTQGRLFLAGDDIHVQRCVMGISERAWHAATDALELQLTQAHGKNVELAERVKELEFALTAVSYSFRISRMDTDDGIDADLYRGYAELLKLQGLKEKGWGTKQQRAQSDGIARKLVSALMSSADSGKDGE